MIEVQKALRNKPHGVAAADPKFLANHETWTRLAQTMAGLVRELKTIPDGRGLNIDWEKREQQHQREFYELRQSYQTLQSLLEFRFNQIQDLKSELVQERKKNLHNKLTAYIHVDRLRRALGTLDDELKSFRDFASLSLSATDESIKVKHAYAKCRKVI